MPELQYRVGPPDRVGMDFVISTGTRDSHGTRINPGGWVLTRFLTNPVALAAHGRDSSLPIGSWEDMRVEGGRLVGRLKLAAQGTSTRIDEIRSLMEQGFLRAASAGFAVLRQGKPGVDEYDYMQQELIEASVCAIGSNPDALLQQARALGISPDTVTGLLSEHAVTGARVRSPGGHADTSHARFTTVETISQKVQRAETDLNGARDALSAHLADDNADSEATEQLSAAVEAYERHLTSMKRAEKALAARAGSEEPPATEQILVPAIRRPLGIKMREPKPHELIYRAAACALQAYVTSKDPIKVLEERYGDHEATQIVTRAAVDPAKTSVAGWAQELVEEATTDFLATLRPISIFPRLAELGQPLTFGPGRASIRVPSRATTPSISGSFVAEGAPIPVRRLGLTSITLSPHKLGVISVFTREMARYSNPQIEGLLRQEINADTAITIDTLLLDATAGSTTRPAGLTFGISAITPSAAGGYAAILADINALAAPFDAANAGRRLVLIMNPREARALNMAPGPDGTFGWAAGFMSEFTVLTSTTVTPGRLVMIDAADLVTVNGTPEFDVSEQTVLHMEDTTPLNIGTPGAPATIAAPAQSMFQTASLALRMLLDTTWAMRRAGMVQYMTGASWAPAP